jgi:hypothetical protein
VQRRRVVSLAVDPWVACSPLLKGAPHAWGAACYDAFMVEGCPQSPACSGSGAVRKTTTMQPRVRRTSGRPLRVVLLAVPLLRRTMTSANAYAMTDSLTQWAPPPPGAAVPSLFAVDGLLGPPPQQLLHARHLASQEDTDTALLENVSARCVASRGRLTALVQSGPLVPASAALGLFSCCFCVRVRHEVGLSPRGTVPWDAAVHQETAHADSAVHRFAGLLSRQATVERCPSRRRSTLLPHTRSWACPCRSG